MTTCDLQRQERYGAGVSDYTLMLIADEDKGSKVTLPDGENYFMAHLRYCRVRREAGRYGFEPVPEAEGGEEHVYSKFGEVDRDTFRGGEFSELVKWGHTSKRLSLADGPLPTFPSRSDAAARLS